MEVPAAGGGGPGASAGRVMGLWLEGPPNCRDHDQATPRWLWAGPRWVC